MSKIRARLGTAGRISGSEVAAAAAADRVYLLATLPWSRTCTRDVLSTHAIVERSTKPTASTPRGFFSRRRDSIFNASMGSLCIGTRPRPSLRALITVSTIDHPDP